MEQLRNLTEKETITSLEILEQINFFRKEEGKKKPLRHDNLLKIIRDEFEEEISLLKIQESTYKNDRGREYPMYMLTLSQGKQVLIRESKFVRRSVIHHIEELQKQLENITPNYLPIQNIEMLELKNRVEALERKYEQNQNNYTRLTVSEYAKLNDIYINSIFASKIGKEATCICQAQGIRIEKICNMKYGFINTYPIKILDEIFGKYIHL